MFYQENEEKMPHIPPAEMKIPFTEREIRTAAISLKNNKSPGIDNLNSELIKYGPTEIYQDIAELINTIARTGEYPSEIKEGILIPLQKPGKKKGPPGHLRAIILLSVLRKLLAICLIRRTCAKYKWKTPISQAAYSAGRSTTEHVFTFKVLAEKAIA